MEINKYLKPSNPVVVRLKSEHALLSTEINDLNRELIFLKDMIRRKQKSLRGINIVLIHKTTRGPFLSVVKPSVVPQSAQAATAPSHNITETQLVCLQGGKCRCK